VPFPLVRLAFAPLLAAVAVGQAPAPGGAAPTGTRWAQVGEELLVREDPVAAWTAFRRAAAEEADEAVRPETRVGLGRTHLMLGRSDFALSYAEAAIATDPASQSAMALGVRALIRARAFDDAVRRSGNFVARAGSVGPDLRAARASALFRVQRIDEAAEEYRRVLDDAPLDPEANLRLGSGLLGPVEVQITDDLREAVRAAASGDHDRAKRILRDLLRRQPGNPVAHRLLGEVLFAQRAATSMAATDPSFAALRAALPRPDTSSLAIADFVNGYERLSPERRLVVDRTAALFAHNLDKLIAVGGSHDLLRELDRTTDAAARAGLRGRRTFDGRVWDDVRGMGGIRAATGIEALDEAAQFGFDTLAHEVAHQVHLFTFTPLQRARIRSLYQDAIAEGRCLDYYAASNEAEYFGQGVEAFVSFGKHPGGETTHGHTRFELFAVDRGLHDFIASVVAHDPLADPTARERVLEASVAVAIRCGRATEALTAASMMGPGALRARLLAQAAAALAASCCH